MLLDIRNRLILNSPPLSSPLRRCETPEVKRGTVSVVTSRNQFCIVNFTLNLYCIRHFYFSYTCYFDTASIIVAICLWHIKVLITTSSYMRNEFLSFLS